MTLPSQSPPLSTASSHSKALTLINSAKSSGRCIPSLLPNEAELNADTLFLSSVSNLVDYAGSHSPSLIDEIAVGKDFFRILEMTQNIDAVTMPNVDDSSRVTILIHRRAILLLIIGCTSGNNQALNYVLQNSFLSRIKVWLEDILTNKVGGVDLLLHLLSSITMLPVSKDMVTSSKLGKLVANVEKHKICVGGMNENAIKERVSKVKEEWSASVKRIKKMGITSGETKPLKRNLESEQQNPPPKKSKSEPSTKSSFSKLIQQVSGSQSNNTDKETLKSSSNSTNNQAKVKNESDTKSHDTIDLKSVQLPEKSKAPTNKKKKKDANRRIRWADHEGGPLSVSYGGKAFQDMETTTNGKDSWKDRKKRDRLKEKELIQKARKNKLADNDDNLDTMAMIFSSKWHQPSRLPHDTENPSVTVNSQEVAVQTKRMASAMPLHFLSDDDVPSNPYPLTETEQQMDLHAQMSSVPHKIPFFFSQQSEQTTNLATPAPVTLPVPPPPTLPTTSIPPPAPAAPFNLPPPTAASLEVVRSMGLPDFLAGQNVQALQAILASPGLLNTFVDVNGNYDQIRIMSLIHVMNQQLRNSNIGTQSSIPPPPPPPPPMPLPTTVPPPVHTNIGHYGPTQSSQYKPAPQSQTNSLSSGYRGDKNNTDGNLHLSGYGPNTPIDSIVALFAPYVKVDQVVPMSGGYMFLNTSDPEGARRAKDALNGVMIGGTPLKINAAVRKNKTSTSNTATSTATLGSMATALLPRNALGQIDYDAVRDDKGNPATKNLFVAGYGQGTTEQQLRDVFNQHTVVTGIVMKERFSFVNTSDKASAVSARQNLIGSILNGSALRINFAKESGRLGTSFDSSANASNNIQPLANLSHYGHSY